MKKYELTYIISPDVTFEEAQKKAKEIESAITNKGGTVLKQLNPEPKTLSYNIKGKSSGFFGVIEFELEPENLLEVKTEISKGTKILRQMIIVKRETQLKKERRQKETLSNLEPGHENPIISSYSEKTATDLNNDTPENTVQKHNEKEKIELEDIDQKLEEILN